MTVFFQDLQLLSHDTVLTLYRLTSYNPKSMTDSTYFTSGVGVIMNNIQYLPCNCEIDGEQYSSEGSLARPKIRVDDRNREISTLTYLYDGLEGSRLEVYRTLKRYLDTEATSDPTALRLDGIYEVSQRLQEIPGQLIEFELSAPIDFIDESVPARPCSTGCSWIYRDPATCTYSGAAKFTFDNRPTLDPALDACSKSVTGCTKRFGKNAVLPGSFFPGLRRF